jgi:hypothetical protein
MANIVVVEMTTEVPETLKPLQRRGTPEWTAVHCSLYRVNTPIDMNFSINTDQKA